MPGEAGVLGAVPPGSQPRPIGFTSSVRAVYRDDGSGINFMRLSAFNHCAPLDAVKATAARQPSADLDRLSPQRGEMIRPGRRNGAFYLSKKNKYENSFFKVF